MKTNLSRIMREIYEMENPNPHLFEDIVEIRKLMAADESEVLKRMEFDADFRAYIKSFLKEIRTNKLYTWYKRKRSLHAHRSVHMICDVKFSEK